MMLNNNCQSTDKKCCKPIIPKIKTSCQTNNNNQSIKKPNNQCKQNNQCKPKSQKQTYNFNVSQYQSNHKYSHIKNFPNQQDLQKMTKKQLAQTYYQQFLKLNRENQVLEKQLSFVRQQRDILYKKYNELKEQQKNSQQQKPKRQRRVATQIRRDFNCPVDNCDKSYGSQGSLIQHIKLKHQSFYGTPQYHAFLSKQSQSDQE